METSLYNLNCRRCPLHEGVNSVCIPSRGADKPVYFFVGEAPGEQEDLRNAPFVGDSGGLLLKAIQEYDLKPARLSNAVKCRPPGNREPKPEEIASCMPFLQAEMAFFKPQVVVACGNVALRSLTGKNGILKHAGRIVGEFNGSKIFAIYHPAYVLRYPFKGHAWETQLKTLKMVAEGVPNKEIDVQILPLRDSINKVADSKEHFVTFDLETSGSYKQYGGSMRCIGFHTEGETFVSELDYGKDVKYELGKFAAMDIKKCAHNSIFEMRWFLDEVGMDPKNLVYDTMLLHYLLDENKPHNLESVVMEHCENVLPWKIEQEMTDKGWTWGTIPFQSLAEYCGRDAYYTHQVMKKFIQILKKTEKEERNKLLDYYNKILIPLASLCSRFESRGMKVDSEWALEVDRKYLRKNEEVNREIRGLPRVAVYIEERLRDKRFKGFTLSSSDQVRDICTKLGIKTKGITDGGQMSVASDYLKPFENKSKFVNLYLKWKEKETLRNMYLKKFPKFADKKGLIHAGFNPAFQVTNRISVSNPPCSNIPRDPEVRGIICSRFKNGNILALDYKQLEMRLLSSEAGEKKMLKVFAEDGDVHSETAKEMFGKDFTPEDRDNAKAINFSTVYGIEEYSFSLKYHVKVADARKWLGRHREIYPEIYKWMKEQHAFIKKNGWIESRFGLRRRLPEAKRAEGTELDAIFRQAGNFPIQSQGASITNLAGIKLDEELEKMVEYQSVFYHIVHDSLVIDCYPGEEEEIEKLGRKIMDFDVPSLCPWLKVDLPVDSKIGHRWGSSEGV